MSLLRWIQYISRGMRFPTIWYVRPERPRPACANAQSDQTLCLSFEYSMSVKLLTEHHLEFLSLTGYFTGSSESTLVKLPNCWKSHDFYFRISNRNKCSWTRSKESQRHKTGYWKEITGDRRRKIIFRKGNRKLNFLVIESSQVSRYQDVMKN